MDQHLSQFPELANILAASLNEIYLFEAESLRFRFANLGALQNLGYTLSQMQAMIVPDIKPDYPPAKFRELISPLIQRQKTTLAFETVHRRADGSQYPVEVHLQLFEWDGQRLFLAVILDITGRKQIETALRESEAKYRLLFELESDALFLIDNEEGQILDANKAAEALYGYTRDELLRMRNVDLSAQPDQTSQATAQRLQYVPLRYHRKKDGTVFPVEITAAHLTWNGRPSHMPAIRDITERLEVEQALHQSEERMRYIIQHAPYAIVVLDRNLCYIALSERYQLDYDIPKNNIIGKNHYDFIPKLSQRWKDLHQRVLSGAVERSEDDYFERPDGTIEYIRWECRPWYQPDGSIGGLVTYSEITTERKLAEQRLKESEQQYRSLFERMAQGVVYQDADYKITSANPAALRILGLTMDQIQGRTSMDPRWRSIHEDGSDFPGETHPSIVSLKTGQVVNNVAMGVFNPQTEAYTWININAVPQFRPGEDRPYQTFTTFEDITVLKQNEMVLKEQLEELRRWHNVVIGREKRVLELKQEVNELLRQAGRAPRYLSVEEGVGDG
jgi:PAS domain S-box-containing protein